jgi:hypothetical protein
LIIHIALNSLYNIVRKVIEELVMLVSEKIQKYAQKLPEPLQIEVLDFVEYLLSKTKREKDEDVDWSNLSLVMMMRDMEDETTPEYNRDDLKVVFK